VVRTASTNVPSAFASRAKVARQHCAAARPEIALLRLIFPRLIMPIKLAQCALGIYPESIFKTLSNFLNERSSDISLGNLAYCCVRYWCATVQNFLTESSRSNFHSMCCKRLNHKGYYNLLFKFRTRLPFSVG
jgi:hypothetical protein